MFHFVNLRALCGYRVGSEIQREMAVISLRGANRVDCATSQLCEPLMTSPRPSITARYPSSATFSTFIAPSCLKRRDLSLPARSANPVFVAPGQKQVTVTPELRTSFAIASVNEMTYALVA